MLPDSHAPKHGSPLFTRNAWNLMDISLMVRCANILARAETEVSALRQRLVEHEEAIRGLEIAIVLASADRARMVEALANIASGRRVQLYCHRHDEWVDYVPPVEAGCSVPMPTEASWLCPHCVSAASLPEAITAS